MKFKPSLVFDLAVIVFFVVFVYEARDWRLQARLYPWAVGLPMLALALAHLIWELKGGAAKPSRPNAAIPVDVQFTQGADARRRTINIFCWIFGFFAAIWLLGFNVAVPLFVFLYLKVQSREGWALSFALTAVAWLLFWGLFVWLLRLPFPDGAVFSLPGVS